MAKTQYPIHEDFKPLEVVPASMFLKGWIRPIMRLYSKINFARAKAPSHIETRYYNLETADGAQVKLELYRPKKSNGEKLPLIIYYHGGGFVFPPFNTHKETCWGYAEQVNAAVLFVRYRLSPQHQFPTPFNDCYEAFAWARENADNINVDVNNISLTGDSAGGALATTVTQKAVDTLGEGIIKSQILVYPVLDNQCNTESATTLIGTPVFDGEANKAIWQYYLGEQAHATNAPAYAVANQYANLEKLPLTYIENAEFDPLKDEAVNYSDALKAAGVEVLFHHAKGAVHGFDAEAESAISKAAFATRVQAFKQGFDAK